jgi:hypothetical protein
MPTAPAAHAAQGELVAAIRDHRLTVPVAVAGRITHMSRNVIYREISNGTFPGLRLGNRVVVPIPALLAYLGMDNPGAFIATVSGLNPDKQAGNDLGPSEVGR